MAKFSKIQVMLKRQLQVESSQNSADSSTDDEDKEDMEMLAREMARREAEGVKIYKKFFPILFPFVFCKNITVFLEP